MRRLAAIVAMLAAAWSCSPGADRSLDELTSWSFDSATIVPADRSLARPESGAALADDRLIAADQIHGLRAIEPDGSSRPFGRLADAGYVHEPPARPGGANGVSLEPGGTHLLVCDVFTGAIYRVDAATEATDLLYTHPFGINVVRRDRTGAIWFTQSTENSGAESQSRLFAALDVPSSDGALFRIAPARAGELLPAPDRVVGGLYFANGLAIDEDTGHLYLAETTQNRVLAFHVGAATGELSDRRVVANVLTPDNLDVDDDGLLWIASPVRNEVVVVGPQSGRTRAVFRAGTAENDRIAAEWLRRGEAGEPRLELLGPALWAPLPGLVTGVILTPGDGPVYLTGVGDALVRLPR